MKIFIMTDLEGISGVSCKQQVDERDPFTLSRLMTDVNAAIRGAFDGGADEVYVEDGHGTGKNFPAGTLDPRAIQVDNLNHGCTALSRVDAAFVVGAHAMAGTENAFLDHTQTSLAWHNYLVNGRTYGEIGQIAIYAGAFDVPLVMVSGDFAACAEARQYFGNLKTAVVKFADGRNFAECLPLADAENAIYTAAKEAVRLAKDKKPHTILYPAEIKVEFNRCDYCDMACAGQPLDRIDGRTARKVIDKIETFCDIMLY